MLLEQDAEDRQETQELIPVEQQTLLFYGKPIVVVRLPDGRPAVVLRFLCENMGLESRAQIRRIRVTEVIADDLAYARIQTEGGPQTMAVLVLHGAAFWLSTIDTKRVRPEVRPDIVRYQKEAVDVLYAWAQTPRAIDTPKNLVPSEPVVAPTRPVPDAPLAEWRDFYVRMAAVIEWQMEVDQWRGSVESRLEGLEAMTGLIPEILERLGPQTLTRAHQKALQTYVKQLHEATGKPYATIYEDLKLAFAVPRYQDIAEEAWEQVVRWFQVQIERGKKK